LDYGRTNGPVYARYTNGRFADRVIRLNQLPGPAIEWEEAQYTYQKQTGREQKKTVRPNSFYQALIPQA
jgi:hypothetical protein